MRHRTPLGALLLLTGMSIAAYAGLPDADPHATGYRPPTAEDRAWFEANAVKVESVRLNALGLQRAQESLIRRGNPLFLTTPPAPVGQEAVVAGSIASNAPAAAAELPDAVDNSELPYFPPISSQGNLGCCAAFSTTYYQFSHMVNYTYDRPYNGNSTRFSPKWTFNFVNGGGNNGTNFTDVYKILKKHGGASWADRPYDDDCTSWSTDAGVWTRALNYRIDQTGTLGLLRNQTEIDNLKGMLANGYVIAFSTSIGNWQYTRLKNDPSTDTDNDFVNDEVVAWTKGGCDHAMVIVGYNDNLWIDIDEDNSVDAGEKGAIKIANSWGNGYSNDGFTWIAYDALSASSKVPGYSNSEKGDLIIETAWITIKQNYEPILLGEFTLNTAKRNQMIVRLGYSSTNETTPTKTWDTEALNMKAGALGFDGNGNAVDGTFVLDFTDLIVANGLADVGTLRWYVQVVDEGRDDAPVTIKNFKVIKCSTGETAVSTNSFPQSVEMQTCNKYVDFSIGGKCAVTASGTLGGTLSQNGTNYFDKNSSPTISCTPDNGFIVDDVIVDGASTGSRTSVTFDNITGDHTVEFKCIRQADDGFTAVPGVVYKYYEGSWTNLPNFADLTPVKTGSTDVISLDLRNREDYIGFVFTGYISVPTKGEYTFGINSDDGSRLTIGSTEIAEYDGVHGADGAVNGSVWLDAGYHAFTIDYFDGWGGKGLELFMAGPGIATRPVAATDLFISSADVAILKNAGISGPARVLIQGGRMHFASLPAAGATLSLCDMTGRMVLTEALNTINGSASLTLPASLSNGFYIASVKSGGIQIMKNKVLIAQ